MNMLIIGACGNVVCLLWGIVILGTILIGFYLRLKFYSLPREKNRHELQLKADAFEREKEWAGFEKNQASTDQKLIEKNKDLENQLILERTNNVLLNKQLKVYKDFVASLNLEIKPIEKENSKKE